MDDVRFDPQNALTRGGRGRDEVAETEPEPVGPIAAEILDDLAARQRGALDRLARAHRTRQETQQP